VDCAALLEQCVEAILRLPQRPDVVVATGDLVDSGGMEEYAHVRRLLAPLSMPIYLIPGNRDDRAAMRSAFSDHAYLHQWQPFIQYAVDDWPLRIVALDTVVPTESGGRLCVERLDWLDRTLASKPDRPTLLIMHHPPFPTFIGSTLDSGSTAAKPSPGLSRATLRSSGCCAATCIALSPSVSPAPLLRFAPAPRTRRH